MSTRAHIIIQDEDSKMIFYRHSDGYPKCAGAELVRFIQGYYSGAMRPNVGQSAGWLIVAGHAEYLEQNAMLDGFKKPFVGKADASDRFSGWKVGAYEPTDSLHCDVEFIYIIDLKRMTLSCRVPTGCYWDKPSLKLTKACAEFPYCLVRPDRRGGGMIDHVNQIGLVEWFNDSKGYGFISIGTVNAEGIRVVTLKDIFAHYTAISGDGFKTLAEGQEVEFDLTHTPKGPIASNIRKLNYCEKVRA